MGRRGLSWMMIGLALLVGGYVAIAGALLARTVSGILVVGPLAQALGAQERPADPLALGYRGDPMTALGLPFETVVLETPLGPAEAWQVPAPQEAKGQAIYVHGIAGAREDGYRHLSMLHAAGWSVLLVTYRNDPLAPASVEGRYGFGLSEWRDLEAAVQTVASGPGTPPLLIVAESMGGAVLGQFLARSPLADRVDAIALDSPAISFGAVVRHLAGQTGWPLSDAVSWCALALLPWWTGLDLDQAEVASQYVGFPHPLFIAHGSGDRIVPIAPSQILAGTRSATTGTVWTAADHLGSFAEAPDAYSQAFTSFLSAIEP